MIRGGDYRLLPPIPGTPLGKRRSPRQIPIYTPSLPPCSKRRTHVIANSINWSDSEDKNCSGIHLHIAHRSHKWADEASDNRFVSPNPVLMTQTHSLCGFFLSQLTGLHIFFLIKEFAFPLPCDKFRQNAQLLPFVCTSIRMKPIPILSKFPKIRGNGYTNAFGTILA